MAKTIMASFGKGLPNNLKEEIVQLVKDVCDFKKVYITSDLEDETVKNELALNHSVFKDRINAGHHMLIIDWDEPPLSAKWKELKILVTSVKLGYNSQFKITERTAIELTYKEFIPRKSDPLKYASRNRTEIFTLSTNQTLEELELFVRQKEDEYSENFYEMYTKMKNVHIENGSVYTGKNFAELYKSSIMPINLQSAEI